MRRGISSLTIISHVQPPLGPLASTKGKIKKVLLTSYECFCAVQVNFERFLSLFWL